MISDQLFEIFFFFYLASRVFSSDSLKELKTLKIKRVLNTILFWMKTMLE